MSLKNPKEFLNKKVPFYGLLVLLIISALFSSSPAYNIGNIFFGGVARLYNVNLAQYFFLYASYPLVGKSTPYAHHQLSRTYFIQGDFDTAISEANKELEIHPEDGGTYYILGLTYGYMNQEKKAIDSFSKYIDFNPKTWAARNDKAWLQFRIGDIDGALATISPVALNKNNPWVQNTLGTLFLNKKNYKGAQEAFLNAKRVADSMTEEEWGIGYPGNDPRIYNIGLSAMRKSIENNLKLLEKN